MLVDEWPTQVTGKKVGNVLVSELATDDGPAKRYLSEDASVCRLCFADTDSSHHQSEATLG
jgi:hypothetical protein